MNFSIAHEFAVEPAGFWQLFFSEEFEQALWKRLKMRQATVLVRKDEGSVYRRSVKLDPEVAIPSWAAAAIKDTGYIEHDLYYPEKSHMDVRIEPLLMKDRFDLRGTFVVKPAGPGRCRREFSADLKISIPLLGGKIEKMMAEQVRQGYDDAAQLTHDWLRKKQA